MIKSYKMTFDSGFTYLIIYLFFLKDHFQTNSGSMQCRMLENKTLQELAEQKEREWRDIQQLRFVYFYI